MEISDDDLAYSRYKEDIEDRIDLIFQNYSLEKILEMNDIDERRVIYLLYMEGHIKEPEAYLP